MRPLSRNVGNQLLTYKAQYPTRAKTSKLFLPHNQFIPINSRHISIKFTDPRDVWRYSCAIYILTAVVLCTYQAVSTWATLLFQTRFYRHDLHVSSGPLPNSHPGVNIYHTNSQHLLNRQKHIKKFHSFVTQTTNPNPNQTNQVQNFNEKNWHSCKSKCVMELTKPLILPVKTLQCCAYKRKNMNTALNASSSAHGE